MEILGATPYIYPLTIVEPVFTTHSTLVHYMHRSHKTKDSGVVALVESVIKLNQIATWSTWKNHSLNIYLQLLNFFDICIFQY